MCYYSLVKLVFLRHCFTMLINWQPHIGKYLHRCDECGEEFNGRKNQLYCNVKCKAKRNNELASNKTEVEKNRTNTYLRNIEIVLSELGNEENEVLLMPMERLLARGFKPEGPNSRVQINGELWYRIGPVAYKPMEQSKEVELLKLEQDEPHIHN
jgi:hypothetical protein